MTSAAPTVVVALGSNLGDSVHTLRLALDRLRSLAAADYRASSTWRSAPVDCPPGSPEFLNAVAAFRAKPDLTPESVLSLLQGWEREFGRRQKAVLNEPRPLDLDLLAFGDETRATPVLTLPHPRACQRRFVLAPLAEVAPDLVLPGQQATVRELLERLPEDPRCPCLRLEPGPAPATPA